MKDEDDGRMWTRSRKDDIPVGLIDIYACLWKLLRSLGTVPLVEPRAERRADSVMGSVRLAQEMGRTWLRSEDKPLAPEELELEFGNSSRD